MDESAEVPVRGDEDAAGGGGELEEGGVGSTGWEVVCGESVVALPVEPAGSGESGASLDEEFHLVSGVVCLGVPLMVSGGCWL